MEALPVKATHSHSHKARFIRLFYVTRRWGVEIFGLLFWRIIVQIKAESRASLPVGHSGTLPVSSQLWLLADCLCYFLICNCETVIDVSSRTWHSSCLSPSSQGCYCTCYDTRSPFYTSETSSSLNTFTMTIFK